ncbi:MAG: TPM domain-containing protein [Bdellovibrionales bacterium]
MVNSTTQLPSWVQGLLTVEQVQRLSDLVAQAESQTSGEIVPVLVHRSSAVGHVRWILIGFLTVVFLVAEALYSQWSWGWHWTWLPPIAFLAIVVISGPISRWDWVQRLLTSQADEDFQVTQRAELEFYRSHIKKTLGGTGILIFVSWMERRAVILADEGIAQHYPPETWDEVVEAMTQEFRQGHVEKAFEVGIRRCGEILKVHLTPKSDDRNELHNRLVIGP